MKRLIASMLILVLIFAMTACGSEKPGDDGTGLGNHATKPSAPIGKETEPTDSDNTEPSTGPGGEETTTGVQPLNVRISHDYLGKMSDNYITLANVYWQRVLLDEESADQYPKLQEALLKWNAQKDHDAHENLQSMLPDAQRAADEMGQDFYGYNYESVNYIQRADSRIFSMRSRYDAYTGGLRPFYGNVCLNLDPATGEKLTVEDIMKDWTQLPRRLTQGLNEKYGDWGELSFEGVEEYLAGFSPEDYTWTMNYQGVTFYFGVSEIAATAVGELEVTLWFDRDGLLFREGYDGIPAGGYATALAQLVETEVDLTPGDSVRDDFWVCISESGGLGIRLNDEYIENEEFCAFSMESYLVTPDGQRFFLYVDAHGENDYRTMYIYDLSSGVPKYVTQLSGDGFYAEWLVDDTGEENYYYQVFNDPAHFTLGTRINVLGTMTGWRDHHMIAATGIPQPETEYYHLNGDDRELTSLIPLEVLILPDQKTETIPAGSVFYFLRTNNETYVDMRLEDGRECRVLISYHDWQPLVNGLPEDECFDGIMYAG